MTTTSQTVPPAAAIVASGGATSLERVPSPAVPALDEAGLPSPAAASSVLMDPRHRAEEASSSRSLGLAAGKTATALSAVCAGAERAQTTAAGGAWGSGPAAVQTSSLVGSGLDGGAGGRRGVPRLPAPTSTDSAPLIGGGAESRWNCPPDTQMKYAHGTVAAARIDRCRCDLCTLASRRYMKRRALLMAAGKWQPFVDAEPVRAHVRALQARGVGRPTITKLAGLSHGAVSHLLYGNGPRPAPVRIKTENAAAILALDPADLRLPEASVIDAAGSRRRIQALVAWGWPQNVIAHRLGMSRFSINDLVNDAKSGVKAGTAEAIRKVYDELWDQPPPEATRAEKISVSRARNYARNRGWRLPMGWDDDTIDDPSALHDRHIRRPGAVSKVGA